MRTAELVAGVLLVGAAGAGGHVLARSTQRRARVRRLVRARAFPLLPVVALLAVPAALRLRTEPPRRYADYLPDDGPSLLDTGTAAGVLAAVLLGAGLVLLAVRLWLGRPRPELRNGVPAVGVLLVAAGVVLDSALSPGPTGWYMYSPLTEARGIVPSVAWDDGAHDGAAALALIGLGVLAATVTFRVARGDQRRAGQSPA